MDVAAARPMNWLASFGRAVGNNLPDIPHATAIINRGIKPLYCRLYPGRVHVPLFGYSIILDPSEAVDGRMIFYPDRYDRAEVAFLRDWLRPGDTFVDAGANAGFYTFLAARLVGAAGHVVSIEAAPDLADLLRQNLAANGIEHVEVLNLALADESGSLALYLNETGNMGGNSAAALFAPGRRSISVPADTLTRLVAGRDARALKLDIEGMEYPVLQEFFANAQKLPPVMIVEHPAAPAEPDHIALCKANGYEVLSYVGENYILRRDLSWRKPGAGFPARETRPRRSDARHRASWAQPVAQCR